MIKNTSHTAKFASSRVTLVGDIQHKSGITAVVGRNGSGKSFQAIEVPRWLLFGKKALRGAAADYADASATGVFEIRGRLFEISRGKEEWIKGGDGLQLRRQRAIPLALAKLGAATVVPGHALPPFVRRQRGACPVRRLSR
jgi:hypothetical protein